MGLISSRLEKLVRMLAGPAAEDVIAMLHDESRPHRAARQQRVIEKAAEHIIAGTAAVPENILLTILERAAVADDEQLLAMWAALLARAALRDESPAITPVFLEILKQISTVEATFLLHLQDIVAEEVGADADSPNSFTSQSVVLGTDVDLLMRYLKLGLGRPTETREQALRNIPGNLRDFMAILDNLERLNLLFHRLDVEAPGWGMHSAAGGPDPVRVYHLTMLGYQFIRACQTPP